MMMSTRKRSSGFTLIELLVVIAIIGILSAVVLVSLSEARKRGRDAQRVAQIKEIQKALELYRHENGHFPVVPAGLTEGFFRSQDEDSWSLFKQALSPYIANIPVDPVNIWPLTYYYRSSYYPHCPNIKPGGYFLIVATEATEFDLTEYEIQGENGSMHRYCLYGE